MLEDFRLKVFLTVVSTGSFTKAAAALGVTQPAVSHNVAELEKALGVRLFERLRQEVVLTPAGEVFRTHAEQIASSYRSLGKLFCGPVPCHLRISASEEVYTHWVVPALEEFRRIHPEVTFEKSIFDDCDLKISLVPHSGSPFDRVPDCIARLKVLSSEGNPDIRNTGDLAATRENVRCFCLLFQPSEEFSRTRLCALLKEFLSAVRA